MLQQRLRTHHQLSPPQPQESEPQASQSYQTGAWRWTPRRHGRTRRRAPRGARRHGMGVITFNGSCWSTIQQCLLE
eukprot:8672349-Pyramimonas_sp.AAC.1